MRKFHDLNPQIYMNSCMKTKVHPGFLSIKLEILVGK